MPTSTTVNINITGNSASLQSALRGVGTQSQATGERMSFMEKRMKGLHSALQTIHKALFSMFGVLVAFNLFITLPQKIIQGLVASFKAGIQAIADLEQSIIGLQAVLASNQKWFEDPVKNFEYAGKVAFATVLKLIERSKEMVLSLNDILITTQTLLTTGVGRYAKNMQEVVDLAILLGNATAAVTKGQGIQRQQAEEIRSLMTAQFRTSSLLVRFFFTSAKELRDFNNASGAELESWVERIKTKLEAFNKAALSLGNTWQGIKTSFEAFGTVFAKMALDNVFERIKAAATTSLAALKDDMDKVQRAAAVVSVTIEVLVNQFLKLFGLENVKAATFLDFIIEGLPTAAGKLVEIVYTIKNFINMLILSAPITSKFLTFLVLFGRSALQILSDISAGIADIGLLIYYIITGNGSKILSTIADIGKRAKNILLDDVILLGEDLAKSFEIALVVMQAMAKSQRPEDIGKMVADAIRKGITKRQTEIAKSFAGILDLSKVPLKGRPFIDLEERLKPVEHELRLATTVIRDMNTQLDILRLSAEGAIPKEQLLSGFGRLSESMKKLSGTSANMDQALGIVRALMAEIQATDYPDIEDLTNKLEEVEERVVTMISRIKDTMGALSRAMIQMFDTTGKQIGESILGSVKAEFGRQLVGSFKFASIWSEVQASIKSGALDTADAMNVVEKKMQELVEKGFKLKISFKDMWKSFTDSLKGGALDLLFAFGNELANVFEAIVTGSKTAGAAFKEMGAAMLMMIGKFCVSLGAVLLVLAMVSILIPGLGWNAARLAIAGAALLAIGAAAMAAGAAMSGKTGASGAGAGSGATAGGGGIGSRTIYMEPYMQQQKQANDKLITALTDLNGTLTGIKTQSPGVLVKEGVSAAGKQIAGVLTKTVKLDSSVRTDLSNAVLGET